MQRRKPEPKTAEKKGQEGIPKDPRVLYQQCARQHALPSFDTLNTSFDIDTIDTSKHVLKEIAKRIFDRIDLFKKVLEGVLQPDTSLLTMQEAERLTEQDHEMVMKVVRTLMHLDRMLLEAELLNNDAKYAAFIAEASKEWPQVRRNLAPVITRMQAGWNTKQQQERTHHYLG
jgi:NhaP-type Na+/H+ and K+/H+ antiporter